ncbi:hypothetical protein GCM10023189_57100 [Nibrella saemangeumensis]|uniref:Uncharacterized protein n=1 Tax=Nibrella saemangeumensis TaxID=1084526 RepID=A0ABP8NQL3_9BACT
MEAIAQPTVVRVLCGINPSDDTYYRLTFYDTGTVRIERPYSLCDTHQPVETIEEAAERHKWLVWDIEEHQTEQWV